jgi:septum site-determining protein MinC
LQADGDHGKEHRRPMQASNAAILKSDTSSPVILRGRSKGLEVVLDGDASLAKLAEELESKLEEAPHFFAGGDVSILFEGRLPEGCLGRVEEIVARYAMRVTSVKSRAEAETQASRRADPAPAPKPAPESHPAPTAQANAPKLIAGPVRSGVVLEVPGNVVIVGDVNPGAEVVAAGNIVVLGTLRGIAHAACAGDDGFVLALQLAPQQLRIGSLIARAGDADSAAHGAEIAYAKGGQIIVETYRGKLPSGLGIGIR